MTLKDLFISIFFLGSIFLVIAGGWNYMKGRILIYEEQVKVDKMLVRGQRYYNADEVLGQLKKEKTNSLLLFSCGLTGFFLVVTNFYRRKTISKQPIKTT